MTREVALDTETTGLDPRSGHKVIEIACIELEDLLPTGRIFHRYVDPGRDIDPEAERVHGISRAFLVGKPSFAGVADALLAFIGDSRLIAHNAAFDRGFINAELEAANLAGLAPDRWACTLEMAKLRYPGMYNSLDALCKRLKIPLAEREKHGALIDTRLLAQVYLELQGGKERALDLAPARAPGEVAAGPRPAVAFGPRPRPLAPRSTPSERAAHAAFVAEVLKGRGPWADALAVRPAESSETSV